MPDPHMRLDADGRVILDNTPNEPTPAQRAQAIQNCDICDQDGYRGHTICDHTDRTDTYRRGMQQIRDTMGWK